MSTQLDTRDDVVTGLDFIEGIDLDLEVQCEDINPDHAHEHGADVRVRFVGVCGDNPVRLLCRRSYHQYLIQGPRHLACGTRNEIVLLGYLR